MSYGITTEGFVGKPLEVAKSELEAAFRAAFGAGINLAPQSVFGQLVGIFAEREAELWELAEGVYLGFAPDSAAGAQLDNLAALTGAVRLAAAPSSITATATGTPLTLLPAGRIVSVDGSGARFVTLADATIEAVDAWVGTTAYSFGDRVTNGGKVYQCVAGGTSAGSGGPSGTGTTIGDGGVTWKHLGTGTGAVDVACESEETGPVEANTNTLTVIETPVAGWSNVVNNASAALGRDVETDAAFRLRREVLLRSQGKGTLDALRADVLAVDGVTAVQIFENVTDADDADGLPPHSFEVVVLGGAAADIAQAIWDAKPAGIRAYGTTSGSATDADGVAQVVEFTRPTAKPIYIVVNLTKDAARWPADGGDQVAEALVAYGQTFAMGDDVISSALLARVFQVAGVVDVLNVKIGLVDPPITSTTVSIAARELATFDVSRVTVNAT
jgi:uncharacterized phage protein gp47/JayE